MSKRSSSLEPESVASPRRSARIARIAQVDSASSSSQSSEKSEPLRRNVRSQSIQEKSLSDIKADLKTLIPRPTRLTRRSQSVQSNESSESVEPKIVPRKRITRSNSKEGSVERTSDLDESGGVLTQRRATRSRNKSPTNQKTNSSPKKNKNLDTTLDVITENENEEKLSRAELNTSKTDNSSILYQHPKRAIVVLKSVGTIVEEEDEDLETNMKKNPEQDKKPIDNTESKSVETTVKEKSITPDTSPRRRLILCLDKISKQNLSPEKKDLIPSTEGLETTNLELKSIEEDNEFDTDKEKSVPPTENGHEKTIDETNVAESRSEIDFPDEDLFVSSQAVTPDPPNKQLNGIESNKSSPNLLESSQINSNKKETVRKLDASMEMNSLLNDTKESEVSVNISSPKDQEMDKTKENETSVNIRSPKDRKMDKNENMNETKESETSINLSSPEDQEEDRNDNMDKTKENETSVNIESPKDQEIDNESMDKTKENETSVNIESPKDQEIDNESMDETKENETCEIAVNISSSKDQEVNRNENMDETNENETTINTTSPDDQEIDKNENMDETNDNETSVNITSSKIQEIDKNMDRTKENETTINTTSPGDQVVDENENMDETKEGETRMEDQEINKISNSIVEETPSFTKENEISFASSPEKSPKKLVMDVNENNDSICSESDNDSEKESSFSKQSLNKSKQQEEELNLRYEEDSNSGKENSDQDNDDEGDANFHSVQHKGNVSSTPVSKQIETQTNKNDDNKNLKIPFFNIDDDDDEEDEVNDHERYSEIIDELGQISIYLDSVNSTNSQQSEEEECEDVKELSHLMKIEEEREDIKSKSESGKKTVKVQSNDTAEISHPKEPNEKTPLLEKQKKSSPQKSGRQKLLEKYVEEYKETKRKRESRGNSDELPPKKRERNEILDCELTFSGESEDEGTNRKESLYSFDKKTEVSYEPIEISGFDFIDDEAMEGSEESPSANSNEIIDEGESINSTESEIDYDDDYEHGSFVVADDDVGNELLSGSEELDTTESGPKKRKRIISVSSDSDDNDEVTEITDDDINEMSMKPFGGSSPSIVSVNQISSIETDLESLRLRNEELSKMIEEEAKLEKPKGKYRVEILHVRTTKPKEEGDDDDKEKIDHDQLTRRQTFDATRNIVRQEMLDKFFECFDAHANKKNRRETIHVSESMEKQKNKDQRLSLPSKMTETNVTDKVETGYKDLIKEEEIMIQDFHDTTIEELKESELNEKSVEITNKPLIENKENVSLNETAKLNKNTSLRDKSVTSILTEANQQDSNESLKWNETKLITSTSKMKKSGNKETKLNDSSFSNKTNEDDSVFVESTPKFKNVIKNKRRFSEFQGQNESIIIEEMNSKTTELNTSKNKKLSSQENTVINDSKLKEIDLKPELKQESEIKLKKKKIKEIQSNDSSRNESNDSNQQEKSLITPVIKKRIKIKRDSPAEFKSPLVVENVQMEENKELDVQEKDTDTDSNKMVPENVVKDQEVDVKTELKHKSKLKRKKKKSKDLFDSKNDVKISKKKKKSEINNEKSSKIKTLLENAPLMPIQKMYSHCNVLNESDVYFPKLAKTKSIPVTKKQKSMPVFDIKTEISKPTKSEFETEVKKPIVKRNIYKNIIKPSYSGSTETNQFQIESIRHLNKQSVKIKKSRKESREMNLNAIKASLTGQVNNFNFKEELFQGNIIKKVGKIKGHKKRNQ